MHAAVHWQMLALAATMILADCGGSDGGAGPETPQVAHVVLSPTPDSLLIGQSVQLLATATTSGGQPVTGLPVSWHVSNSALAALTTGGLLTGVAIGAVTVDATISGHADTISVTIKQAPVAHVAISPTPDSLHVGQSVQLLASATTSGGQPVTGLPVSWHVSNAALATLTPGGLLTGVAIGTVTVDATISGHADTISVAIKQVQATSIVVAPGGDTLATGQSVTLVPTALDAASRPLTGRTFTYATGDAAVATVSPVGVVTAVGLGEVDITVSTDAVSAAVHVLVPQCASTMPVNLNSWTLTVAAGRIVPSGGLSPSGFYNGQGVLYAAGFVVGSASGQTVTGYEPASQATDFAASPVCQLAFPGESHTYSKLSFTPGPSAPSALRVTQETFAYANVSPSYSYVLMRYSITNTSGSTIPGVVAGFIADWDLNFDFSPINDVARRSPGIPGGEAIEPDTNAHPQVMGLVSIAQVGTFAYAGWTNGTDPTRAGYYSILTSAPSAAVVTGDIRELIGQGAIGLAPGEHRTLYFAIVGGDTRAAFQSGVTVANARANALGYP
jgi:uncharacterized protein YjdB